MNNREAVKGYRRLCLITCPSNHIIQDIEAAFDDFCRETGIPGAKSRGDDFIVPGTLYIVINDSDLASLIKAARKRGLVPGRDLGIISYNDTPLKEIIDEGISVITTDFRRIGRCFVDFVLRGITGKNEIGTTIIRRASF